MERKIRNIIPSVSPLTGAQTQIAVCEDGTAWEREFFHSSHRWSEWYPIPPITK